MSCIPVQILFQAEHDFGTNPVYPLEPPPSDMRGLANEVMEPVFAFTKASASGPPKR